jgi:hypothetical protein
VSDNSRKYMKTLEAAVDDLIHLHESCGSGKIKDADACEIAGKVATRLRSLAYKLSTERAMYHVRAKAVARAMATAR